MHFCFFKRASVSVTLLCSWMMDGCISVCWGTHLSVTLPNNSMVDSCILFFYFWGQASVAAASGHACVLCIGEQLNGDWQRCHSLSMQAALFQEAPFPLGTGGPFPPGGGGGGGEREARATQSCKLPQPFN